MRCVARVIAPFTRSESIGALQQLAKRRGKSKRGQVDELIVDAQSQRGLTAVPPERGDTHQLFL